VDYETPTVDVLGSASESIQARVGFGADGMPAGHNLNVLLSNLGE
jgi:hypothetical protein